MYSWQELWRSFISLTDPYLFSELVNDGVLDLDDGSDVIGIQVVQTFVTTVVALKELEVELGQSREALAEEQDATCGCTNAQDDERGEAVVQA